MASKKNRSTKRARKSKSPASSNTPTAITAGMVVAGAKFGYRLVKSVGREGVTFVNTNGCKPSNKPATQHVVSRQEFLDLVN